MILADIRNYIRDRDYASLADIADHFDADPVAVRHMLEVWIRKGHIVRQTNTSACGACHRCNPETIEVYAWIDAADRPISIDCGVN